MEYSKELILQLQEYWRETYREELTDDLADQYLDSLASLFLAFAATEEKKQESINRI